MKRVPFVIVVAFLAVILIVVGAKKLHVQQRQYTLNRQLITALVRNDSKQALNLVTAGADPNTHYNPPPRPSLKLMMSHLLHRQPPADDSPAAFMIVCGVPYPEYPQIHKEYQNDPRLAESMLAHGANVRIKEASGWSAILGAAYSNHVQIAILLLEHGANANVVGDFGMTPLMWAALHDDSTDLVRVLLAHGAKVNARDDGGQSVLLWACKPKYNTDTMRLLLKQGANPNIRDMYGITPIMLAQDAKRPDIVALFRKSGK